MSKIGLLKKQILFHLNLKECLWKRGQKDLLRVLPCIKHKFRESSSFLHKDHFLKQISCIIAKLEFQAKV